MFLRIRNQNCVLGRKPRWPPEGRAGRGRTTVRRKRSPNAELRVGPRNGINLGLAGPVSGVQVTPRRDARPSVSSCPRRKARGARGSGELFAPTPDGRGRGSRVARLPRSRSRPFSFHSAHDPRDEPETCRRRCGPHGAAAGKPAPSTEGRQVAPQNPAGTRGRATPCATLRLTLTLTLTHAPSPPRAPSQPHAFAAEAQTRPQEGNVRPEIAGSGLRRASAARLPSESPFCRPRPRAQTSGFADALEPPPVGQTRSRWVSLPPSALPATVHATVSGYV